MLRDRLLNCEGSRAANSTCVLKSEPGKLDIKRRESGILFISLQVGLMFKLVIMTLLLMLVSIPCHWRRHSENATPA